MGAGASTSPEVGVALNPRVQYASKIAQSEGRAHLIDAPVLVDLPEGTVRYRYVARQQADVNDSKLSLHEGPHRGNKDLEHKKGYFFHARLADYSKEANETKAEAEHKFKYVFRGPQVAKNKKLYYVTSKGMHASGLTTTYSDTGLTTPTWSDTHKQVHHVYYSLEPHLDDVVSEDDSMDVSEEINSNAPIMLTVNSHESIEDMKEKVSMHILKPTAQIHVFYMGHEIRRETNIASLVGSSPDGGKEQFRVKLVKLSS